MDRVANVRIGVDCQIFVTVAEFYILGHIQGIIRVHYVKKDQF